MKNLKRVLILITGSLAAFASTLLAQPVVVAGTGDPNLDVPGFKLPWIEAAASS